MELIGPRMILRGSYQNRIRELLYQSIVSTFTNYISYYRYLVKHYASLVEGIKHPKFLVPCCGKTLDMIWLMNQPNATVIGVEGIIQGIQEFSVESKIDFTRDNGRFVNQDGKLQILLRNFLDTKTFPENVVNCVWDRGALVAMPLGNRIRYVETMKRLINTNERFNYLLDVYEYDSPLDLAPPHCVTMADVESLFGDFCAIKKLSTKHITLNGSDLIPPDFKANNTELDEVVYLLTNK